MACSFERSTSRNPTTTSPLSALDAARSFTRTRGLCAQSTYLIHACVSRKSVCRLPSDPRTRDCVASVREVLVDQTARRRPHPRDGGRIPRHVGALALFVAAQNARAISRHLARDSRRAACARLEPEPLEPEPLGEYVVRVARARASPGYVPVLRTRHEHDVSKLSRATLRGSCANRHRYPSSGRRASEKVISRRHSARDATRPNARSAHSNADRRGAKHPGAREAASPLLRGADPTRRGTRVIDRGAPTPGGSWRRESPVHPMECPTKLSRGRGALSRRRPRRRRRRATRPSAPAPNGPTLRLEMFHRRRRLRR